MTRLEIQRVQVAGQQFGIVQRTVIEVGSVGDQHWCHASRTPVALLLQQQGREIAVDMNGNRLNTDELRALGLDSFT